jgi:hypothetical protein
VEVLNAFIGRHTPPTDTDLAKALGPTKPVWDSLIADLAAAHEVASQEWKSYSPKAGWALRLMRGKRTVVWLAPCKGCVQAVFILGDKAMAAARQSRLATRILKLLDESPRYPEGTGVRLLIKGTRDIPTVMKLAAVKLAN